VTPAAAHVVGGHAAWRQASNLEPRFVCGACGNHVDVRPNFGWELHEARNKKARQVLLHSMDQLTFLYLSLGQSKYYRSCNSVFACGSPYATTVGAETIAEHNKTKAIQLVKESGYDGTPVVVLQITNRPFLNAAAVVTRQRQESVGFRRSSRRWIGRQILLCGPARPLPTKVMGTYFDPAVHFGLSGAGPNAWFGWPNVPQLEKLETDWVRSTDHTKRKQLAAEIQKVALDEVTYVPWGEWLQPTVFEKTSGMFSSSERQFSGI
jgi:peptide/nickel transport system substrate-binding protein